MSRADPICQDEDRILGLVALAAGVTSFAAIAGLVVALAALIHGCAPSRGARAGAPSVGVAVVTTGGTIAYDLRATPGQVAKGTPYVARYLDHWAPLAGRALAVRVVADGSFAVRGFCDLASGSATVSYGADGTVYAVEWEIPLLAQGSADPPSWTWGEWGPIYPGQAAPFLAATVRAS